MPSFSASAFRRLSGGSFPAGLARSSFECVSEGNAASVIASRAASIAILSSPAISSSPRSDIAFGAAGLVRRKKKKRGRKRCRQGKKGKEEDCLTCTHFLIFLF